MPKANKPGSHGSQKRDEKKPTVPQAAETKKQEVALPTQSTEVMGKGRNHRSGAQQPREQNPPSQSR